MIKRSSSPHLKIALGILFIGVFFALTLEASAKEKGQTTNQEAVLGSEFIDLNQAGEKVTHLGFKIVLSLITLGMGFVIIQAGVFVLNLLSERAPRYRFLKKVVPAYQALFWLIIGYVIVFFIFRPAKETLFAFLTASGVAIGFAAQDILKNVFGGLTIILDRPFQIGDKINVGSYYGEVIQIGIRTTKIVTPDDNTVSVPNSEIVNKAVSNANSGELACQVTTEIDIPLGVNLAEARSIAWEAAVTSQYVYLKKPVMVLIKDAPTEQKVRTRLKVKAYVLDTRLEFAFSSDISEAIKEEFRARDWMKRLDAPQKHPAFN